MVSGGAWLPKKAEPEDITQALCSSADCTMSPLLTGFIMTWAAACEPQPSL